MLNRTWLFFRKWNIATSYLLPCVIFQWHALWCIGRFLLWILKPPRGRWLASYLRLSNFSANFTHQNSFCYWQCSLFLLPVSSLDSEVICCFKLCVLHIWIDYKRNNKISRMRFLCHDFHQCWIIACLHTLMQADRKKVTKILLDKCVNSKKHGSIVLTARVGLTRSISILHNHRI